MAHTWHTDYVNMITSDDCQERFNMEIWKSIQGYEGLYKISSYGNIKGSKFNKNLKPADNSTGYKFVNLSKEGILKKYFSVTEANKVTNICMTTIVNCCNKKYNHKTAGGYIWK